jgi:ribonuclease HII
MQEINTKKYIIGIDEVGRGPVAGPVVVCACAVACGADVISLFPKEKLKDSKKLSEKVRLTIVEKLESFTSKLEVISGVGVVDAEEIDSLGISMAIKMATEIALQKIHEQGVSKQSFIFLDGSLHADKQYEQETVIKGDEKIIEISLASIIAKVYRDTLMKKAGEAYPRYGFESHVGYGTKAHYEAITRYGLTPLHRKSFLKRVTMKQ